MSLPMFKFDAEEDLRTEHGGSSESRSRLETSDNPVNEDATKGTVTTTATTRSPSIARLEQLKEKLSASIVQYPGFPTDGILFEDIFPLFNDYNLHENLIEALEILITKVAGITKVDKVVGLESRGFLFGTSIARSMRAGFTPIRKKGKLPGKCDQASYQKEYGADHFEIQSHSINHGDSVIIVDDLVATGGSAAAAEELVKKQGAELLGFVFIMELSSLKGRDKLGAPVWTLLH